MSDISDVLNGIAAQVATYVYPNGTGEASVTGVQIRTYAGWPTASTLDQDLQNGIVNVSVYPVGTEIARTRYSNTPVVTSIQSATLTMTVSGRTVTVGGAMPNPFSAHNMAVIIDNAPFLYSVQSTDTLTSIATALASLIAASISGVTSSGPVITLPVGLFNVVANVGTFGSYSQEWERQAHRIQITVWAPDPNTRNLVSAPIKQGLAQIAFLTMPDGYGARVKSQGGFFSDALEKAKTYRRDLIYEVEYATTTQSEVATVVAATVNYETSTGQSITSRTY